MHFPEGLEDSPFNTCCTEVQNQMEIISKLNRCLYQKTIKHYTTTTVEQVELESVIEELNDATEDMNVFLSIRFPSKDVTIFEEILIFDEISLIELLGGSLVTRTFCRFLILWLYYNFSGCHSGQNI